MKDLEKKIKNILKQKEPFITDEMKLEKIMDLIREMASGYRLDYMKKNVKKGKCSVCGKTASRENKWYCKAHRQIKLKYLKEHRAYKKAFNL